MLNKLNISPGKQKLIVYIVLTVVTLAVFWQVNQFDFVNFDDEGYVTDNSLVQSGITLDGFRWALSTKFLGLWNPLVWLSLMLDHQLFGLNAGGYHITNLILHIMSALLLFWLFNRMTGAIWKSAFVAALFALHPMHVESVAWVAERKDVLSAFFWMLTLCLYVYYTEKPVIKRYLLVVFGFVCALMSKPMVVTLPVIMILLDYWPLKRFELKKVNLFLWQLKEKTPFFILSAVLVIITLYIPDSSIIQNSKDLKLFPLVSRLANAPVSFVTYLGKTFWPHDMAVLYPFSDQLPLWQVLGSAMLIIFISIAVIAMTKRLPYLFVGWLWFTITIAPVIGILQISLTAPYAMADRYHYLPSIGLAVMLAWGIPPLIKRDDLRKKILFPVATAFLIILAALTWQQCGYWKDSATLFNHALRITKDNYVAHNNLGYMLSSEGKINEAIDHYNEAIHLKEDYADSYNNRGIAYKKLGQYQSAIGDFNKAISLKPNYAVVYNNRGNAYNKLDRYQLAIEDYNKSISLKKDFFEAYFNRGVVYNELGQYHLAILNFNKAISLKKNYVYAYNNRAFAYFIQGNKQQGCYDAQKACALGNCKTLDAAKAIGYCR